MLELAITPWQTFQQAGLERCQKDNTESKLIASPVSELLQPKVKLKYGESGI